MTVLFDSLALASLTVSPEGRCGGGGQELQQEGWSPSSKDSKHSPAFPGAPMRWLCLAIHPPAPIHALGFGDGGSAQW